MWLITKLFSLLRVTAHGDTLQLQDLIINPDPRTRSSGLLGHFIITIITSYSDIIDIIIDMLVTAARSFSHPEKQSCLQWGSRGTIAWLFLSDSIITWFWCLNFFFFVDIYIDASISIWELYCYTISTEILILWQF